MPQTQTDVQWVEGFNGRAVNKTSNLLLKLSLLLVDGEGVPNVCFGNRKQHSGPRLFSFFLSF